MPVAAQRLSVDQLRENAVEYDIVETEGLVEDVFVDEIDSRWIHFQLNGENDSIMVAIKKRPASRLTLDALSHARIRLSGVYFQKPASRRVFAGPRILVWNPSDITILTPAPDDPLDCPMLDIGPISDARHLSRLGRHSVTGVVRAVWGGLHALLDTGKSNVRLDFAKVADQLHPGDIVKAAGQPETDLFFPILTSARFRVCGSNPSSIKPMAPTTTCERLYIPLDGRLGFNHSVFGATVRIEGIVARIPSAQFPSVPWEVDLRDGTSATVDTSAIPQAIEKLEIGTKVSVVGVAIPQTEIWRPSAPFPRVTAITLVPRTADDIAVLAHPPWWTVGRLLVIVALLSAILVALVVWHFIARANNASKVRERTRLAVELHDSLSQNMTGLAFQIASAKCAITEEPSAICRHLDTAEQMLLSTRTELKRCLWDLRSDTLEDHDFAQAIRRTLEPVMVGSTGSVRFPVPRQRLDDTTAHNVLCIIRELAANAVRHGRARHVRIAGECHDGRLSFSVRDDGCGFAVETRQNGDNGHFGLDGIAERVDRLDGRLEIHSVPGKGTHVIITDIRL